MKAGVEGIDLRGGAFGEAYGATRLVIPAIEPCPALRRIPIWKCLGVYEYHYMPTEPVSHHEAVGHMQAYDRPRDRNVLIRRCFKADQTRYDGSS
jgi:hypothetical protein